MHSILGVCKHQAFRPNLPTKHRFGYCNKQKWNIPPDSEAREITPTSQHGPKSISRYGPLFAVPKSNPNQKNPTFPPKSSPEIEFWRRWRHDRPRIGEARELREEEEDEELRWRLEEAATAAAIPNRAEQKKARNTARSRSSRCLGTARTEAGRQLGRSHEFGLELNDKEILPAVMNDCEFATTYRQGEQRKKMKGRGRESKGEVLRFLQLTTSCLAASCLWP